MHVCTGYVISYAWNTVLTPVLHAIHDAQFLQRKVNEVAAFHSEFCLEAVMHQRQLSDLKIDFLLRDAFELRSSMCFDRILVGGDCPPEELQALYLHLNDGGIMVAPSQGQLIRIGKVSSHLAFPLPAEHLPYSKSLVVLGTNCIE